MLLIGIAMGIVVGITSSFEPLLNSLALLIASLLPTTCGLGFLIGFLSINGVTRYITTIISPNKELEGTSKSSKINPLKALNLAKKAAISHYTASNFCLLVSALLIPMITVNSNLLVGSIILPMSVIVLSVLWGIYVLRGNIKLKLVVITALSLLGFLAITFQGSRGTIILFTSLFSLQAAVSNLNKKENKIPTTNLKEISSIKGVPIIKHAFGGLLSSVVIGFPGAASDKFLSNKQGKLSLDNKGKVKVGKTSSNEVHETIGGSISNGVQSGLGISLFLIDSVTRDSASTVLSTLFTGIVLTSIEMIAIIAMFVAVGTAALFFFDEIAKAYIQYSNFKIDSKLEYAAKLLSLVIIVVFIIFASMSNIFMLGIIVASCFTINWFISKHNLDRELVSIVTLILPALALTGII